MKKILILFFLLIMSTTTQSIEKEYRTWGNLTHSGGIESIVPYPTAISIIRIEPLNPSSYGNYVSFSIWIKVEDVRKHANPYILLQNKDGTYAKQKLGKNAGGTKDWNRYSTPSIFVPPQASKVIVGVSLHGTGKVEYHDGVIKEK